MGPRLLSSLFGFICAVLLTVACSSEADVGEPCGRPGGGDGVCAEGTVCGKRADKTNALACIPICRDDKDCPSGQDCKGVDGAPVKGCRIKD